MQVYGEGSVIRREDKPRNKCRKWTLRVQTDHGPKDKRITGTYSQAKQELESFKAKLVIDIKTIKFSDYARTWLDRRERAGEIAESTMEKDRNLVKLLCRKFGNMVLSDITRPDAVDGLLEIKTDGNYSSWYYNGLWIRFKSILSSAKRDGYVAENVLDGEPAPKVEKTKRRALTVDEFHSFALRLSVEPLKPHIIAVYLAMFTGSRRGEICGFTWDDIDLESGTIWVRRSVMDSGKAKMPKSTAGIRVYPIVDELVGILKRWQRIQERELETIGVKQTVSTPVVNNDLGQTMNPQNLDRWWRQHRDEFGLPGVVLHELRHTFLTILANSGAPSKVIQDMAGWSSIKQADIYVHPDVTAQRAAVDNLGAILGSKGAI